MDLPINDVEALTMHIDLNSAYAILEQQANRLIRNKPVGVAAYDSPGGFIVTSSYEARRLGVHMMRVKEAKKLAPDIIIMMPDPDRYFYAHRQFKKVLERYTNDVDPKSVDEFVVNFKGSRVIEDGMSMTDIGFAIKRDIKEKLGEYVTVNIGIAPNRFLAKIAAGLDKPDGLDVITSKDILNLYGQLDLMDLPGINIRNKVRLHFGKIYTPLEFFEADHYHLRHQVFGQANGMSWYQRLRGYEVDAVKWGTKSFGNDYALGNKTSDRYEISRLIMKLCEKAGRRLRKHGFQAHGVFLSLGFVNWTWWGESRKTPALIYATQDIYHAIMVLFKEVEIPAKVSKIKAGVFYTEQAFPRQLGFFDGTRLDTRSLAEASDRINDRYGEFRIIPSTMANMQKVIIKRVPFGSVRDI